MIYPGIMLRVDSRADHKCVAAVSGGGVVSQIPQPTPATPGDRHQQDFCFFAKKPKLMNSTVLVSLIGRFSYFVK
jgi:hypothetical protein